MTDYQLYNVLQAVPISVLEKAGWSITSTTPCIACDADEPHLTHPGHPGFELVIECRG